MENMLGESCQDDQPSFNLITAISTPQPRPLLCGERAKSNDGAPRAELQRQVSPRGGPSRRSLWNHVDLSRPHGECFVQEEGLIYFFPMM